MQYSIQVIYSTRKMNFAQSSLKLFIEYEEGKMDLQIHWTIQQVDNNRL